MTEVLLNVAPFRQPAQRRNPGGDCFACAVTAAVRHIFPEKQIDFDTAFKSFETTTTSGTPTLRNTWTGLWFALHALRGEGYPLEIRRDLVIPAWDVDHWGHCWWHAPVMPEWAYRLEAWLAAGWVALAEVALDPVGPYTADGKKNLNDHFLILDGQRHYWRKHPSMEGAYSAAHETHVVCSAKGAYWMDTDEFLHKHGAAGIYLIRRDSREYR